MAPRRLFGFGVLATGVVCPCHALMAVAVALVGAPALAPPVQDGVHAVYVPTAVLGGAWLLRLRARR